MSYQVIARKWRPQTFEEVTGQEAITRTLRNAVEHDRLHHAYLFSGARGVGKTTTARLLAKALNCHKSDKPTANPCSINDETVCASCREIAEGRSIDVLEIDAASHTGIDDVRETIIESININPARDRYKVFIIDEVHQLSKAAFNALLKTLEEPPPRVAFIMATTELHKVPDTILSRCQEFEFRTIASQKIFDRLKTIAEAENITISVDALREIARSGEGSMRDAQSNFDQVISFSGERIESQDVAIALGLASAEMLTKTAKAIAENKPAEVLNVVDDLIGRGQDLRNFCRDLMSFFRDLLIYKMADDAENLLDTAVLSRDELRDSSAPFSESDLIRFFNSLSETESKLREATQPRCVLEIGLVKLVEMRRVVSIEKILERLAKLEAAFGNVQTENSIKEKSSEKSAEKKTSTIDFPLEEVPFPVSNNSTSVVEAENPIEIANEIVDTHEEILFQEPVSVFENSPSASPKQIDSTLTFAESFASNLESLPMKLPPILSEELEHIEDAWLDDAFERKLQQLGDDLSPIKNASEIVESLLGENQQNSFAAKIEFSNGGAATAFAPAKDKPSFVIPEFDEEESTEIPVLPENPTDEEMWQYAQNHPLVKKVLRVFRGKIVEVNRIQDSKSEIQN
ncbi:MAG: DNA polymerase III subunit gamma/tau [Acidobacteria bacterium]|jgi:DNA polymerase-3 subunit gamma/tau|nr:DNA polymerase III subunit gamma/tau [Acidobacteriota bacterium]